ncbi:hypothetical protein AAFF_G00244180 [Aldrovandia affinis]|uniref:Uncharacterized protein n=1 Tax=Aldrovandia affinis TaxID=143900 RepID=A0AAD7RDT7_9TELE|nr:hypothetical protein AAFF_G00244180 [Aldrovandia affinis]
MRPKFFLKVNILFPGVIRELAARVTIHPFRASLKLPFTPFIRALREMVIKLEQDLSAVGHMGNGTDRAQEPARVAMVAERGDIGANQHVQRGIGGRQSGVLVALMPT